MLLETLLILFDYVPRSDTHVVRQSTHQSNQLILVEEIHMLVDRVVMLVETLLILFDHVPRHDSHVARQSTHLGRRDTHARRQSTHAVGNLAHTDRQCSST